MLLPYATKRNKTKAPPLNLSRRLQAILQLLTPGMAITDIGSDHALLVLAAISEGVAPRGTAVDIAPLPLAAAAENIRKQGLEHLITIKQQNGIVGLDPSDQEQIVIAGMGGLLVREILHQALKQDAHFPTYCRHLVLQPNNDQGELRRWLADQGWQIKQEHLLFEGRHFYHIISVIPGNTPYILSWVQQQVGPLNLQGGSQEVEAYIRHSIKVRQNILAALRRATGNQRDKREQLLQELAALKDCLP
ncbi:MAG: class I SAM-dependent methyltransferase [Symbiobacteriaceae bacterium]|nr:class I SAM-dependent methyltransferase [Symbiobacteriaceae bacterium]